MDTDSHPPETAMLSEGEPHAGGDHKVARSQTLPTATSTDSLSVHEYRKLTPDIADNSESTQSSGPSVRHLCYALHIVLVVLHLILLALWSHRLEHSIAMPLGTQSNISVVSAIEQHHEDDNYRPSQIYQAAMVPTTQQLALRRNLLQCQTLTAIHDKFVAWTGLGAALITFWGQKEVPSATGGVLLISLYLCGVAILHITSSSLLNLEMFNATVTTTSAVIPGWRGSVQENLYSLDSNHSISFASFESSDSISIGSAVGSLSELSALGLSGRTVYDIFHDTSGIGNATVNATTFWENCSSLPNVSVAPSDDGIGYDAWMSQGNVTLGEGGRYILPLAQHVVEQLIFAEDTTAEDIFIPV
ncbi:hypothetical protein ID866_7242 [Astraeus odoratus]|nr:hypothetical protein ID866_7242 [Astraeus odoratus]